MGQIMKIRDATAEDVPAIAALLADDGIGRSRERPPDDPCYLQAFDRMCAQGGNVYMVLEVENEIRGCLQYTVIPGLSRSGASRAQLEGLRVSSSYRSLGYGDRLMATAIDRARADGCSLVQLSTDTTRERAHRFYTRLGFLATHHGMKLMLTGDD